MSSFLVAEGFGYVTDGAHSSGDQELLGSQWSSIGAVAFNISDMGDGRKWFTYTSGIAQVTLSTGFGGVTELSIGMRVYRASATGMALAKVTNASGTLGFFTVKSDGLLEWYNYSYAGGSTPSATSSVAIPLAAESYVEVHLKVISASAGEVTFFVNGVQTETTHSCDVAYLGTNATGISFMDGGGIGGGYYGLRADWKVSDIVVKSGTTPIEADVGVYYEEAAADTADQDFTPLSGSDHYAMVDEIGPDGDTTYNESDGTAGHRDGFTTAGGVAIADPLTVGVHLRAKKTGAGTGTLIGGVAHAGSTEAQGSAVGLTTSYRNIEFFQDTDPSTASAWTVTNANAAEVSAEVGA